VGSGKEEAVLMEEDVLKGVLVFTALMILLADVVLDVHGITHNIWIYPLPIWRLSLGASAVICGFPLIIYLMAKIKKEE
jgi:hypothetical protein